MRRDLIGCVFILLLAMVGCSSLGANFTPVKSIPDGQSLIYLYYPPLDKGDHRAPEFHIVTDKKTIVKLERGGYFPYFVDAGELTLTSTLAFKLGSAGALNVATAPKEDITLKTEPGQTIYLEGVPYFDGIVLLNHGMRFNPVADEFQAQLTLEECKLLPKYVPLE